MKFFDTETAAEKIGISGSGLRQLRIEGRIKGIKFGNSWAFTDSAIASLKLRPVGRPIAARVHKKPRKRKVSDVEQEALRSLGGDYGDQKSQKGDES